MEREASIVIRQGQTVVQVPVSQSLLISGTQLADKFVSDSQLTHDNTQLNKVVLLAEFLNFCLQHNKELAAQVFAHFVSSFCNTDTTSVHQVVEKLDKSNAEAVLRSFYAGWAVSDGAVPLAPAQFPDSAKVIGTFGGTLGCDVGAVCLGSIRALFDIYRPLVADYLEAVSEFLERECQEHDIAHLFEHGFNLMEWLEDTDQTPAAVYLDSAPIATPLVGLLQLLRVLVVSRTSGYTVDELVKRFDAVVGFSHGLLVAAAVSASSNNTDGYIQESKSALGHLLLFGTLSQVVNPQPELHALAVAEHIDHEGTPTSLAIVKGTDREIVEIMLKRYNKFVGSDETERHVHLAATLVKDAVFAISGNIRSLSQVVLNVRRKAAAKGEDQSAVPFAQRKPQVTVSYVQSAVAPLHSPHMSMVCERHLAMAHAKGWILGAPRVPIYGANATAKDAANAADGVAAALVKHVYLQPANWPHALDATDGVTHIVDFAPASSCTSNKSSLRTSTRTVIDGRGIALLCAETVTTADLAVEGPDRTIGGLHSLDTCRVRSWQQAFAAFCMDDSETPDAGQQQRICTRLSAAIGMPPVIIGGMSPTTTHVEFVAAASRAGYLAELEIGQVESAAALENLVGMACKTAVQTGHGLALSSTAQEADDRPQTWLVDTIVRIRQELHLPVLGLGLGVAPDTANSSAIATDILRLHEAGLKYVSFTATTADEIRRALAVAERSAPALVILQWTGGRGQGQHSLDEFHMVLVAMYSEVRRHLNVLLLGAAGFGTSEGALPYLNGEWSTWFDRPAMPLDGIVVRSRVAAARESALAGPVKALVAAAAGLDALDLPALFRPANGSGVDSIRNLDGSPTHVAANRASQLCQDIGQWVLDRPVEQQSELLRMHGSQIKQRLGSDFMRPWFAVRRRDGNGPAEPIELAEMSYIDAIDRLVELTYVRSQRRWLAPSYRNLVAKFAERAAMRLLGSAKAFEQPAPSAHYDAVLDEIETLRQSCAHVLHQQLASADVQFFLQLCTRRGQKPVPFVPVLDSNLRRYLMADAWWPAEDLDAVSAAASCSPEDAAQRVLLRLGPVSAAYVTTVDEDLADILDGIHQGLLKALPSMPTGSAAEEDTPESLPESVSLTAVTSTRRLSVSGNGAAPEGLAWGTALNGSRCSGGWLAAVLTSAVIVQGVHHVPNYLARLLRARPGYTFTVCLNSDKSFEPTRIEVHDSKSSQVTLVAEWSPDEKKLAVRIPHQAAHIESAIELEYLFNPQTPLAPIHELMTGRDARIREFFIDTWLRSSVDESTECGGDGDSEMDEDEATLKFITRGIRVDAERVGAFCRAAGLRLPEFPPNSDTAAHVPMDYLPVLALRSAFKALTSRPVHSGLLHMVQTGCEIRRDGGPAAQLRLNDIVDATACVEELANCAQGKRVVLKSQILRDGLSIADIRSSFLFLGAALDDPHSGFRRTRHALLAIELQSATDVAVLLSKEWFVCHDDAGLVAGVRLEMELESDHRLDARGAYATLHTHGRVYLCGLLHDRCHIADIDYQEGAGAQDDAALAFLLARAEATEPATCAFDQAYSLTAPLVTSAPASAHAYAQASADYNPHNTNVFAIDLAGLDAPLMHGLWTSAHTRALIELHAANGDPTRMRRFSVEFAAAVRPGARLTTRLSHVAMRAGRMVVRATTTSDAADEVVLRATAEVAAPRTVYVFTGQGSQEPGMAMELYERSAAARAVCDRVDHHMRERFGFSLLHIIRTNPHELTVHFGGTAGAQIRRNYMAFTRRVPGGKDMVPLFPEITAASRQYTFRSPAGLLHATQFAQPAIMLFDVAVTADMRTRGVFVDEALFAGHSLGEYGALAAFRMMALEDIVDITFIRGMTMQATVERDHNHRSAFAMVAANPSRVHRNFDEAALAFVIAEISTAGASELLEIVNYNVRRMQYVVAGTRRQLALLGAVLDVVHKREINVSGDSGRAAVSQLVERLVADGGCGDEVTRTRATIPIPGLDVPFHSSHLLQGADQFRTCINMMIRETRTDCAGYEARYIPNLTAVPFAVSREFFQQVYDQTESPVVKAELDCWPEPPSARDRTRLSRLMVIELLSYQFASPVRWIETMDRLLHEFDVEQIVEIGPQATLCRMAEGALMLAGKEKQVAVRHIFRHEDEIFFTAARAAAEEREAKEGKAAAALLEAQTPASTPEVQASAAAPEAQVPLTTQVQAPASAAAPSVSDIPLQAVDVIRAVIAQKIKRTVNEVAAESSVKQLTGGKSTLQNEILGDLLKEFGGSGQIPDRPDEISLQELATGMGASFAGALGKHTQAQISRLFSAKMPGGFTQSAARTHLAIQLGVSRPHQQDAVLLVALTMEPGARLSAEQAPTWLDSVAAAYASAHGITLAEPSKTGEGAGGSNGSTGAPMVSSKALDDALRSQHALAMRQLETYAQHLGIDLRSDARRKEAAVDTSTAQQQQLDQLSGELGDDFISGIAGTFEPRKARRLASYWNWAREDAMAWIYGTLSGSEEKEVKHGVKELRLQQLANRTDPLLLGLLDGIVQMLDTQFSSGEGFANLATVAARDLAQRIRSRCRSAADSNPLYRELSQPMQPTTLIGTGGAVSYAENPRSNETSMDAYVAQMSRMPSEEESRGNAAFAPLLHLRKKSESHNWEFCAEQSAVYYAALREMSSEKGTSFAGYTALVTGCGRGSIAAQVLQRLLQGGARVVATTSSYAAPATLAFFERQYRKFGARGSELIIVPFNQGSVADVRGLVAHIYRTLGWSLDYVVPFAAISEQGCDVAQLGSRSELAARIMLTNVLRLIGEIKHIKEELGLVTRPTLAVLPLSPNHGVFGNDGLYGESKAALETAFNRWESEGWGSLVSVAGAVIGWTRGTGLMAANNPIAQYLEEQPGTPRTFSAAEMAFNLVGLLHPAVADLAQQAPIWADLNGGLQRIRNVQHAVASARAKLVETAGRRSAVVRGYGADLAVSLGPRIARLHSDYSLKQLFNHRQHFAAQRSYSELAHLRHLEGIVNLDKVVVVTGYGEVGPYGNAETRWEMEAFGEFSLEGCVELAWVMGLIKHFSGLLPDTGRHYTGWVDGLSGEPVADTDVKARYEQHILAHSGIRLLEPALLEDQDPAVVPLMRELQLEADMDVFEATSDEAAAFKLRNGDRVDVWENSDGSWSVRFLRGAVLMVPKALRFDRLVGGQLPTGWDPARYGIPADVVDQVDPVTCYAIVATVEALVRAGVTDPYELYQYFHVAQVGTALGSGAGGVHSIRDLYRRRLTDRAVQSDILQETFVNTTAAWINMLLLSSAGAIKPPTGGCGTSVLSIDVAADTIRAGKARVMLAGGFEGFVDQGSYEFAQMGATSSSVAELAAGRLPHSMSRPTTTTRAGFVEAQGAGVVVLMSASAAIECGAPIYAVLAYSGTATDKQGLSLPAPGLGVLTSAAQRRSSASAPRTLDISYRRRQINRAFDDAERWAVDERTLVQEDADAIAQGSAYAGVASADVFLAEQHALIEAKLAARRASALDEWGSDFWQRLPDVSPLRGALAVWGLSADDIGIASFHGTATVANDRNECRVLSSQLRHIGRSSGLAVPAVCQKWLTGHPKGPAAAWMLNGAIQSLRTGIVPGNRNADDIDEDLRQHDLIVFPSRSFQTPIVKAVLLKSFGFGQVGAEMLVVHPDYLLATLDEQSLSEYNGRLKKRELSAYRYWQDTYTGNHPFVQIKSAPPYTSEQEVDVLLDPLARAQYDPVTSQYRF
ncbi:fatty acid synthase alpha subunit Lsd1 [Coemansia sp. RSA 988]|nr:fatty acid synthase alpha subunit Lsd1 [Coemansia sp. RSA 988]